MDQRKLIGLFDETSEASPRSTVARQVLGGIKRGLRARGRAERPAYPAERLLPWWHGQPPRAGRLSRADRIEETHRLRAQGLTHREVADRLDVSVSTVANDLRSSRDAGAADSSRPSDTGPRIERSEDGGGRFLRPVRAIVRGAKRRLP